MAIQTVKTTINGQEYNLTYNSTSGKYEATITAPSTSSFNETGGYYGVAVTATDTAGNSTTVNQTDSDLGEDLQLVVKETVAPTITIISPTTGSLLTNNKPTFVWSASDNDSGVALSTITVDTGTAVSVTPASSSNGVNSYEYTLTTALADGVHNIYINATDNDGNVATTSVITFTVDTVAPTLTVLSPADNLITNVNTVTVSGTTVDAQGSEITLTVNDETVTVADDGTFTTTVSLTEGENTITIVSTDEGGKATTVTRTVSLDTVAPVFGEITITPNPVDCGATFIISVSVTD